ncbi:nuclear factor, interleukin 3 regulated, member 5 isoform X1 [Silurus meridionalis]|nr:nuclear factor, interleukin 3 regulated, member 5 isoform X1 [Silurus meridionalis]
MESQTLVQPPTADSEAVDKIADEGRENSVPQTSTTTRPGRVSKPKASVNCRRKREFISEENKDESYWEKRRKNNEAAKRSREKRRLNDTVLENRVMALNEENLRLKTELLQLKLRFGLISSASCTEKMQQMSGEFPSENPHHAHILMNSDSSEAELLAPVSLPKYPSRGSLSDFSDGSSLDCPEPASYDTKRGSANAGVISDIASPSHNPVREHHTSLQPAPNQRSVILYSSGSQVNSNPAGPKLTGSVDPPHPSALETLSEVAQQLARRSLDLPNAAHTPTEADAHYTLKEHHLPVQNQNIYLTESPSLSDGNHLMDVRFSSLIDDGDPHSSDKEASTDDESPSSSSSSSEAGQSAHTGQNREGVRSAALPHKLRLKHRTSSNKDFTSNTSASSDLLQHEQTPIQSTEGPPEPSPYKGRVRTGS